MSKIRDAFIKNKAFIGYLVAGDGGITYATEMALAMIDGGVDILEIGIPFSDPIADGPVIQKGMQRALTHATSKEDVLRMVTKIKEQSDIPILLFSYFNPIRKGFHEFVQKAKLSGVDGFLIVDLPLEEAELTKKCIEDASLDMIFVIAPSTSSARLKKIATESSGFVYYACQKGTSGMQDFLPTDLEDKIVQIKKETSKPIGIGFGIKNKDMAKKVLEIADGFIVGSLFVDGMEKKLDKAAMINLTKSLDPRK